MDCISSGTPLLALPADTKEREVKNMMLRQIVGDDGCLANSKLTYRTLSKKIEELRNRKEHFKHVFSKVPQNGADVVAQSMKLLSGCTLKELPKLYKQILNITPFKVK